MLGDFPKAIEETALPNGDTHKELATRYLSSKITQDGFARLLLDLLTKSA